MWAFLTTLLLLALALLLLRAWLRHSKLALGIVIGAASALAGGSIVKALLAMEHVPIWLPALPFALIAITLFGFGLLAWFWAHD